MPFSLYLPSTTDRRFPPIGRADLRMLIVVASPGGLSDYRLTAFDEARAVQTVRVALGGRIPCSVLGSVPGAVGPPTLDALCQRLTAERYTLLHVVCHGAFLPGTGETVLYLSDAAGQVAHVKASDIVERLRLLGGARGLPHLTFLGSCESAAPEAEGSLGGLGQRLVRELGMPAVVAMTDRVSIETALTLGGEFYGRLHEHGEVDRALVEAYAALATRPDVFAPVPALLSRLGGQPLFSDTLDRPLTDLTGREIGHGLVRVAKLLKTRAPALRRTFLTQAVVLRESSDATVAELDGAARARRQQALDEINTTCGEVLERSFRALVAGQTPPRYNAA